MGRAPVPSPLLDPARLAALHATGLLDTEPEAAFDRLTRLAQELTGAELTFLSLVDADRQFLKSAQGTDERETPLSHSFCRHVVEREAPLVVEDARTHPLVRDNPAVAEFGVGAYAGVPLRDADGRLLGALCALGLEPRSWSETDLRVLAELSTTATVELELRSTTAKVRRSYERMTAVLDTALDAIVSMDARGVLTEFNPAAERLFGHRREDVVGRPLHDLIVPPEHRHGHAEALARHVETGRATMLDRRLEVEAMHADGSRVPVELIVTRADAGDDGPCFTGFLRDLSERRALAAAEARMAATVDAAPMILFGVDAEGVLTLSEGSGLAALGLRPGEVVGRRVDEVYPADSPLVANVRRALAGETFRALVEAGGLAFDTRYSPLRTPAGELDGMVGVSLDVTEQTRAQRRLEHLAFHDELTGCKNRAGLTEAVGARLEALAAAGRGAALLYVDLDDFKTVNDSLGHLAGDRVLVEAAARLDAVTRAEDVLCRQGGDEFLVFLESDGPDGEACARAAAHRVLSAFDTPFAVDGLEFQVGASVGVSLYPRHGDDFDELLRRADVALYLAKRAGRGGIALYAADRDDARARLTMTTRLRRALAQNEFTLHYQPVFRLDNGRPTGAEALIRWTDPERGFISPGEFIPAAEASGLIVEIGAWVAEAACRQVVEWAEAGLRYTVGFNVSPVQLEHPGFVDDLEAILARTGADPRRLVIEITESVAMAAVERTSCVLDSIAALGISLAIDDFGAGHSSLTRLRHLPAAALKVDRALLEGVPEDRDALEVVRATLALAQALGIPTVAEGVETEAQRAVLAEAGCTLAQGFGLARPMPAADVTDLLTAARDTAAVPA